jgi:hypothetical protein
LGGSPADLQRAFDDGVDIQRPIPARDPDNIAALGNPDHFRARMGSLNEYPNFLAFFKQQIAAKGWVAVIQEHCFSRSANAEKMFAQLFEGLYHPLIHIGLGVEFGQPTIIAEGLAQVASHDSMGIEEFFIHSEREARGSSKTKQPLVKLLYAVHASETLRNAPNGYPDGPSRVREGVLGPKTHDEIVQIASQFQVTPQDLKRGLAETTNTSAFTTGAAQRPGKARKVDFFHMHAVTASIALTVLLEQEWISIEDKVRLVEWKGRLDLVWYAASRAVDLRIEDIDNYVASRSAGMSWEGLFQAVLKVHDDGHLAKLIRALFNGERVSRSVSNQEHNILIIKDDSWLKIAQMAYDSTVDREIEEKWIWGVGFDEYWENVPAL